MLGRAFTIIALLAGLAAIVVTQFFVRPHLEQIIETRDLNFTQWKSQERRANNLQRDLRETETKLVDTEKTLEETQGRLTSETMRADTQTQLAQTLQDRLRKTEEDLRTSQQELAQWSALGLTVAQVRGLIASEKALKEMNAVLEAEKEVLVKVNKRQKDIIDDIIGPNDPVPLPPGTKGSVLIVDPKWKFVVLDIGEQDGIEPRGELMVSRDGILVAKVRITNVYADRCIANVLPGWDFGDIIEGDQVFYER